MKKFKLVFLMLAITCLLYACSFKEELTRLAPEASNQSAMQLDANTSTKYIVVF